MGFNSTADGARLFHKDWGLGQPVVWSHGWPRHCDSWDPQMLYLAEHGFRCVAQDRRGHGRSSQTWHGNEMNTYADDLAALIEALDLRDVILVGDSSGGGEVARYIGRHGTDRVSKVVLVSAVTPFMLRTDDNPDGVAIEVFDALRAASVADRAQLYRDLADGLFFGHDRPGAAVSAGVRDAFWAHSMQSGHRNAFECIRAFSETDFRADLAAIDVPTLVIHGDDDRLVPLAIGGAASAALVDRAVLLVYEGAPHGLIDTHRSRLCDDILAFARA